ncbi:MAG: hypothetical protein WDW36_006430 [Sanguina aurantia]
MSIHHVSRQRHQLHSPCTTSASLISDAAAAVEGARDHILLLAQSLPQTQLQLPVQLQQPGEAVSNSLGTVSTSLNSATASLESMGSLFALTVESATDSTYVALVGSIESASGTLAGTLGSTLDALDLNALLPAESLTLKAAVTDAVSGALDGAPPHFGEVAATAVLNYMEQALGQQFEAVAAAVIPMGQLLEADAAATLAAGPVGQLERGWDTLVDNVDAAATTSGASAAVSSAADSLTSAQTQISGAWQQQLAAFVQLLSSPQPGSAEALNTAPHFGSQLLASVVSDVTKSTESLFASLTSGFPVVQLSANPELKDAAAKFSAAVASVKGAAALGASNVKASVGLLPIPALPALLQDVLDSASHPMEAVAALQAELSILQVTGVGGYSLGTLALVIAGVAALVKLSTPADSYAGNPADADFPPPSDTLSHDYDPEQMAEYFRRRPVEVLTRASTLLKEITAFGLPLLVDLWTGKVQENEALRARQLRTTIERLGPAYVKVAQAISTRVDLLTPAYYSQIQLLQDRVPPFPCETAKEVMAKAFNRPLDTVFSSVSEKPVAAASLGQVYRCTLQPELGGGDVAVKVQRPGVLEAVSLDLYLMRNVALIMQKTLKLSADWAAVIDGWALRFLHEMDYLREAQNSVTFKAQMAGLEGIMVADHYPALTNLEVLTTQWVEGEKLSESNADDVRELCNTLLNCYLIQLLDTGLLHADPHPGNLIRTPDGKICILDFGLMTEVTPAQRIALVEYIAHLSTEDWYQVALDLKTLGFVPPESGDPREIGLVEPLSNILKQLLGGGGAAKVNIDKVASELEELGRRYPFQIPPFFALVIRAFSVIEGSALRVDPDYAIVKECFPYLARRLLSDDSPRTKKLLRDLLYGGKSRLDVARLVKLADGFGAFTTDGLLLAKPAVAFDSLGESGSSGALPVAPMPIQGMASAFQSSSGAKYVRTSARLGGGTSDTLLDPAVVEALKVVFSKQGSYVQELFVEEMVAAVDAVGRNSISQVVRGLLGSLPATLTTSTVNAMGPLRSVLLPVPTPVELLSRLVPAVAITEADQEALGMVRALGDLSQRLPPVSVDSSTPATLLRAARELQPLLPALLPGLLHTGLVCLVFGKDGLTPTGTRSGITFELVVLQPRSRGSVRLADSDPTSMPLIDPNFMADEYDLSTAIKSIRSMREVMKQPSLEPLLDGEIVPGAALQTDQELGDWIKRTVTTMWHPVGTCRMGKDDRAVVDAQLRVNGVRNLRVIDASIMPNIISGNTNAPTQALARHGAELFLNSQA